MICWQWAPCFKSSGPPAHTTTQSLWCHCRKNMLLQNPSQVFHCRPCQAAVFHPSVPTAEVPPHSFPFPAAQLLSLSCTSHFLACLSFPFLLGSGKHSLSHHSGAGTGIQYIREKKKPNLVLPKLRHWGTTCCVLKSHQQLSLILPISEHHCGSW